MEIGERAIIFALSADPGCSKIMGDCHSRGHHPTIFFQKVSPIVVFIIRNDLALVPDHLKQWFWRDFDSKFGVFWAVSGVYRGQNAKIMPLLFLELKKFL